MEGFDSVSGGVMTGCFFLFSFFSFFFGLLAPCVAFCGTL